MPAGYTDAKLNGSDSMLQLLAQASRRSLRATASDDLLVHEVLYMGNSPEVLIAWAHAAVTRSASP